MREGYDIANLPVPFLKLGRGMSLSSLRSSFELPITINQLNILLCITLFLSYQSY